jgi:uncharacterized protein
MSGIPPGRFIGPTTQVRELASVTEIPEREWNRLVPDENFYLSHRWLRTLERNSAMPARYLVLRRGDNEILGALPCYVARSPGTNMLSDPGAVLATVTGSGTAADWLPSMLCGARVGYSSDLLLAPHQSSRTAVDTVRALVDALEHRAHELAVAGCAFLYLNQGGQRRILPHLTGWAPLFASAEAWLDVPWASFDEYVKWLPASRRSIVRRDVHRFQQGPCLLQEGQLANWYEQTARLQVNVQRKYAHPATVNAMSEMFSWWADDVGDCSVVFLCRQGDLLVGYSLAFRWGGTLYLRSAGMDYDQLTGSAEYFNVTYYAPIRYAIRHGLHRIHFGMESFRPKCLRGARLSPLWSAVRANRPVSRDLPAALRSWHERQARYWDDQYADLLHYRPSQAWQVVSPEREPVSPPRP